jgi:adenosylmethionine---8-amino-7-oxononanoate aminotransferase
MIRTVHHKNTIKSGNQNSHSEKRSLWFPYTQMQDHPQYPKVVHAEREYLFLENKDKIIDGISSWWSAIHGYNHPELNLALTTQVKSFSHVMLGGLTHSIAERFAQKLVKISPDGLNHVFFSDSGSVAVEVALKMSIQYWANKGKIEKCKFLSLRNSYHGDTFKAMEVGDDSDFQSSFQHVLKKGYYLNTPTGGFNATEDDLVLDTESLTLMFEQHAQEISAFIIEPIVQCAGGFRIFSPTYLRVASNLCAKHKVLLLFDEVATGFGRTGKLFASEHAGVTPDIMVLGKALTAGYLGHAATITKSHIYDAFLGDNYQTAFMHGPTFMGNPLSCAVGLKSIELFEDENYIGKINAISQVLKNELVDFKHKGIASIRIIGALGIIEVKDSSTLIGFQQFALDRGVWLRPFGHFLYTAPPYIIGTKELLSITSTMKAWFDKK